MVNITDEIVYVNLSKLSTFNETMPTPDITNFDLIQQGILAVFANYPILQWFIGIMIFFILFILLKNSELQLSEVQIINLVSFVLIAFNAFLLIIEVFTITQPIQLYILIWLITVITIRASKNP